MNETIKTATLPSRNDAINGESFWPKNVDGETIKTATLSSRNDAIVENHFGFFKNNIVF